MVVSPKAKAKELFNKFYTTNIHPNSIYIRSSIAKNHAIACCDEILSLRMINSMGRGLDDPYSEGQFWEKVKEELSNL